MIWGNSHSVVPPPMTDILLVEDSPSQMTMITGLLQTAGYDVRCANDGVQAMKAVKQQQPDLVISDLIMPNMNGGELTRAIVQDHPSIPVLVITARGSESLAVDALADGAVNFVPKALLDMRLVSVVAELIERVRVDQRCDRSGANLVVPELIFNIKSDLRAIAPVTGYIQETLAFAGAMDALSRYRLTSAIHSALVNTICYGNLGMRDEEAIYRLIRGETEAPEVPHKVRLVLSVGVRDTRVSVAHDGPAAMTRTSPAPGTPESFELEDCRGMLLITSFMDKVILNASSTELIMVKNT